MKRESNMEVPQIDVDEVDEGNPQDMDNQKTETTSRNRI